MGLSILLFVSCILGLGSVVIPAKSPPDQVEGIFQVKDYKVYDKSIQYILESKEGKFRSYLPKSEIFLIGDDLWIQAEVLKSNQLRNFSQISFPTIHSIKIQKKTFLGNSHFISNQIYQQILYLRQGLQEHLQSISSSSSYGLLAALILGDRSQLSNQFLTDFQIYGLIHLLSISGFHIYSLFHVIFLMIQKCFVSRKHTSIVALSVCLLYLILIGIPLSGLRAFIMLFLKESAIACGREYDAYTALGCSCFILLLWDSQSLYQPGVWLSFLATLGMVTLPYSFRNKYQAFWQIIFCQLWVMPVIAILQGQMQVLTILLTLIVAPMIIFIFYVGWGSLLIGLVSDDLAIFLLKMVDVLVLWMEYIFEMISAYPIGIIYLGRRQIWVVCLYYLLLILFIIFLRKEEKSS